LTGFSIEGPSQAKIDCHDNGDGSADVRYYPTAPGEYAVHILCDNEDIPKSPYVAHILPSTDYYPDKVCDLVNSHNPPCTDITEHCQVLLQIDISVLSQRELLFLDMHFI